MKKILIFIIIIFSIIGFRWGKYQFKIIDMDKKIDKFITEKAGIPSSEILVIDSTEELGVMGNPTKEYLKTFTTKKDFEKWKENLKKEGKNYKDVNVKDCKIQYSCMYFLKIPKYNQTNVYYFHYSLYGGSVFSFKKIENNFEYPPNEYMKKLLKEEILDKYK